MESKKLNSLNIEGLGTYAGGEFDRVNISGKGKVTGNLTCQTLEIAGMSTVEGNVNCERANVSGMGKIQGELVADEINISGTLECYNDVTSHELYLAGMLKAKQCLKGEKVEVSGMLTVDGDMSGEQIKCDGMIRCEGLLNCESLEITTRGGSKLNEVGATNVKVISGESVVGAFFEFLLPDFLKGNKVVVKVIEGDNIELENCEVKVVRGKNVKIGPKCKIGLVEYSDTYEANQEAAVDEANRI